MSDLWLKWTSHLELLNSLDQLLETQSFVDVTIAVEGQQLRAHRVVLCACSWYFNSILRSNTSPHPIIFMRDVKFLEMKAILDFIYKGEALVAQENIQGFLKTAEALKVTGLSNISWAESSMNYFQSEAAILCDMSTFQRSSKDSPAMPPEIMQKDESQGILTTLNENCSEYQGFSAENGIEDLITKETSDEADAKKNASKPTQSKKEAAKVSTSGNTETMMVLEAPSNISITSVPATPPRLKPLGRQYTKDDLQQALEMIKQGQMGIKPAARAFNIPVATLHHAARRSKISSPMQQGGHHVVSYRNKVKPNSGDRSGVVVVKSTWTSETS